MSALSISTNDSANFFGVKLTQKATCRNVNNVKLYHNFNSSFEFFVNRKDSFKIERKDFKESGYTLFRFEMPVDSVHFELMKRDTLQREFTVYGMSLENDLTSGFYLAALGANGAAS